MNKINTTASSLAITLALFEIGATPLFLLGGDAKQDAWLAMTIAAAGGFLLLLLFLAIHRLDPEKDIFEIFQSYWGKWLGNFTGLAFIAYFMLEASRNLRDIGELATMSLLDKTPMPIIMFIALAVVVDVATFGPRVWFLLCIVFLVILSFGYITVMLLILCTGLIHLEFLLPVLEKGFKPVWHAAVPEIISFPFGQTLIFLVYFRFVSKKDKLSKAVVTAYGLISVFLIILMETSILVLGPEWASKSTYPLFEVIQMIQVPKVIERVDALFGLLLFIGLGIKMVTFYIGATIGLQRITTIKYKKWLLPMGVAVYLSAFITPNFTEYRWIGLKFMIIKIWPVFQMVLPVILFITMLISNKKRSPLIRS